MGKIIALANQKGGVAKTTSTYNLGASLSEKGKKVLMVDFDSQASLTISTGLEPFDYDKNIVSIMQKNGKSVKECIYELKESLHIITSSIELAQMEMELLSRASREKILDRALEPVKKEYDYILIDCPPQLSILTINALSCADFVIIPVKTDYLAYRGIEQLMDTVNEIKDLINTKLEVLGVIATMYEKRVRDDNEILQEIEKNYNVIGVVKKLAIAKRGIYDGLSVVEQVPTSEIAMEYNRISDIIINKSEV
jgi:chromosome partitioning protein